MMIGQNIDRNTKYTVKLFRNKLGIGIKDDKNNDILSLSILYKRLLTYLPEDISIDRLGLEPILGMRVASWEQGSNVCIGDIVAWVNSVMIKYIQWYHRIHRSKSYLKHVTNDVYEINMIEFSSIVEFLGETIGIYAIKRILVCLLRYIKEYENKEITTHEQFIIASRAKEFVNILTNYLEKNKGKNEDVKTFKVSELVQIRNIRNSYK